MKIVLCSDLHVGNPSPTEGVANWMGSPMPFDRDEHVAFAKLMHDEKPDVLVVAGDCADTCIWSTFLEEFMRIYKNPHGVSICIPGNHDLWLSRPLRKTYLHAYEEFYKTAAAEGWIGLRNEPWSKDGVYIAGNCCWYDFSTTDPMFSRTPKQWDDKGEWADYGMMEMKSALSFNDDLMEEFTEALSKVPAPDQRKALIVVTHMVGFSFLMSDEFKRPDHGRGFMGNLEIGKKVAAMDANLYYCGHTHRRKDQMLGNMRCICNGSGYGRGSKRFDIFEISPSGEMKDITPAIPPAPMG